MEKIEIFARPLKNARRNLYSNIRKTFSNIREKIPGFDIDMLSQKIENLDENEVSNKYRKGNRVLAQFVSEYFRVSVASLAFKNYDFMTIFGTDDLRSSDPDLYSQTENAAIAYKKYGKSPSSDLIGQLI